MIDKIRSTIHTVSVGFKSIELKDKRDRFILHIQDRNVSELLHTVIDKSDPNIFFPFFLPIFEDDLGTDLCLLFYGLWQLIILDI